MSKTKLIKRIVALAFTGVLVLSLVGCGKKQKIYNIENATDAAKNMGAGWSLGNTLDAFNTSVVSRVPSATETCWGNPVATKELIKTIAGAGFKTVRIPVTWRGHIDDEGNVDGAWLDRVQEVVDYCYAYDLYVIVNMHHDTGDTAEAWIRADVEYYNKGLNKFKNIWTQVAERFSGYDGHLLFEGYNEMLDRNSSWTNASKADAYETLGRWAQVFVDAVRATGGNNKNRNLIITTYSASFEQKAVQNFTLPNDSVEGHLLAEVHMYAPWEFCDGEVGVVNKHTVFTKEYRDFIDQGFERIKTEFVDKGIPVVLGEFAATNKSNTEDRVKYTQYYVSHCKELGASYIWWDNGAQKDMGLFSRRTYECWFPEIVDAIVK